MRTRPVLLVLIIIIASLVCISFGRLGNTKPDEEIEISARKTPTLAPTKLTRFPSFRPIGFRLKPTQTPTRRRKNHSPTTIPSEAPQRSSFRPTRGTKSPHTTSLPTAGATRLPSVVPSTTPSAIFVSTLKPSLKPSMRPSMVPSLIPSVVSSSTLDPSTAPSATLKPSLKPSMRPTVRPSMVPSLIPSVVSSSTLDPSSAPSAILVSTLKPSLKPSMRPSMVPSLIPSVVSSSTLDPSTAPSAIFVSTLKPSLKPSVTPSTIPTLKPSAVPSLGPSAIPSEAPSTSKPSTGVPSLAPSAIPSETPSTWKPTTSAPSVIPSVVPTTMMPSTAPPIVSLSSISPFAFTAPQLEQLSLTDSVVKNGSTAAPFLPWNSVYLTLPPQINFLVAVNGTVNGTLSLHEAMHVNDYSRLNFSLPYDLSGGSVMVSITVFTNQTAMFLFPFLPAGFWGLQLDTTAGSLNVSFLSDLRLFQNANVLSLRNTFLKEGNDSNAIFHSFLNYIQEHSLNSVEVNPVNLDTSDVLSPTQLQSLTHSLQGPNRVKELSALAEYADYLAEKRTYNHIVWSKEFLTGNYSTNIPARRSLGALSSQDSCDVINYLGVVGLLLASNLGIAEANDVKTAGSWYKIPLSEYVGSIFTAITIGLSTVKYTNLAYITTTLRTALVCYSLDDNNLKGDYFRDISSLTVQCDASNLQSRHPINGLAVNAQVFNLHPSGYIGLVPQFTKRVQDIYANYLQIVTPMKGKSNKLSELMANKVGLSFDLDSFNYIFQPNVEFLQSLRVKDILSITSDNGICHWDSSYTLFTAIVCDCSAVTDVTNTVLEIGFNAGLHFPPGKKKLNAVILPGNEVGQPTPPPVTAPSINCFTRFTKSHITYHGSEFSMFSISQPNYACCAYDFYKNDLDLLKIAPMNVLGYINAAVTVKTADLMCADPRSGSGSLFTAHAGYESASYLPIDTWMNIGCISARFTDEMTVEYNCHGINVRSLSDDSMKICACHFPY